MVGVILVALFLAWQWYLERPSVRETYSIWTPPPLMKLSLWSRGKGRFAAMQLVIFCLMAGFQSWILWIVVRLSLGQSPGNILVLTVAMFQLYYQNYEQLSPVLTMIRLIPMFPCGVICNIIIALIVARVDGMVIVGQYLLHVFSFYHA